MVRLHPYKGGRRIHSMDSPARTPPFTPAALPWYCLHAQPKHEHIAAVYLRRYSKLEVFAPRIRFRQLRRGTKMWMTEALFPGYFFARFDFATRLREVRHSHGVRGVVHFGRKYPSLSDALVEQLRVVSGAEELVVVEPSLPEQGHPVRLVGGLFGGIETVVTSYLPAKERVKVLLTFMGRELEVEMPAREVSSASFVHPLTQNKGSGV